MANTDKYFLDEKALFETWISKNYLPNVFGTTKNTEWQLGEAVEFIVRPQCNQKCKYCYITQHGDKIYPPHTRVSNDVLLENISMILDWLIENKIYINRFELFAGDLLGDKLYYQILDRLIDAYSKVPEKIRNQNAKKWRRSVILMPTNGYYFIFSELTKTAISYICKFNVCF